MFDSFYLKKTGQRMLLLFLVFTVVVFSLITFVDAVNTQKFVSEERSVWNKGWLLVDSEGHSEQVSLPQTMRFGNGKATLSRVLDARVKESDGVLCLCSKYENISVSLGGKVLYTYPAENSVMSDVTGITYHYLELPDDAAGQELVIHYTFQGSRTMMFELVAPEYAQKETFIHNAISSSIPLTAISVVVILCGVIVLLMTLRVQGNQKLSNTFWNIGFFAILFALFLFSRSPYAPFLIQNPLARHFLTYAMVLLMPIPFVSMFFSETNDRFYKYQVIAVVLNFINVVTQTALSLLHVVDFRAMLHISLLLIAYSMLSVILGLYFSDNKEEDVPWVNDTAVLVGLGACIDIMLVIFGHPSYGGCLFFFIGVMLFLIAQFSYFLYAYSGQFRTNVESMLLKEMAYKDMLTGLSNRNAYELYLTDITARPPGDRMYGLIADINDLKLTNDNYGHDMGDAIIVTVSDILFKVFGKNGNCFRLGGDEFIAFIRGMSAEQMEQHISEFKALLDEYNKDHEPVIRVALGYAETEPDDYRNMKAFLRRIDKMMYEDKRFTKALERQKDIESITNDSELEVQVESSFAVSSVPDSLAQPIEEINEISAQTEDSEKTVDK